MLLLPLVSLLASSGYVEQLPPPVPAEGSPLTLDNRQLIWLNDTEGEPARCLDGSPYAFYIWPGNSSEWSVFIGGGGWCLTEELCDTRARTRLGSSLGYNISGAWGPPPNPGTSSAVGSTCQGLDPNCTRVYMPYCDGSCFTSDRASPWPVPETNHSLHFRGNANLRRTFDVLETRFGLGSAQRLTLTGGSAGGLSTFLHVDYAADRVRKAAGITAATQGQRSEMKNTAAPLVVGRPVAGFFIDGPVFNNSRPTYAEDIKYGVSMFNTTPVLSPDCKAAHPTEEWKCWMAPYAAPHVHQPLFVVQSRFDEFQLICLLHVPCMLPLTYVPPYVAVNCSAAELTAVRTFGGNLVDQLQPLLQTKPDTGTWLVSCIQHNVVCDMYNTTEEDAFASWLAGGALGRDIGYRWVDNCGDDGKTPCDAGHYCAPPHF